MYQERDGKGLERWEGPRERWEGLTPREYWGVVIDISHIDQQYGTAVQWRDTCIRDHHLERTGSGCGDGWS